MMQKREYVYSLFAFPSKGEIAIWWSSGNVKRIFYIVKISLSCKITILLLMPNSFNISGFSL